MKDDERRRAIAEYLDIPLTNGHGHGHGPQPPVTYEIGPPEPLGRGFYRLRIQDALFPDQVLIHELRLGSLLDRWALADRLVPPDQTTAHEELQAQLDTLAREVAAAPVAEPDLLGWEEMLEQRPVEWLIDGILPAGVLASLTGKWGAGKSFLACAWGCSIATGREWLGYGTSAGGCVYVAAEGYRAERLEAYADRWPLDGFTPRIWFRKQRLLIAQPHAVDAFLRKVETLPNQPRLIVLDTVARCMPGLNENDASDMALVVEGATRIIQATGATVLMLAHPPHEKADGSASPERSRGSSALDGACDTTLFLRKTSSGITLRNTKQKDGEEFPPISLHMSKHRNALVIELDRASKSQGTMDLLGAQFLTLVSTSCLPLSARDLRSLAKAELQWGSEKADEVISYAKSRGYIVSPEGKKQAWTVSEKGRMFLLSMNVP